MSRPVASISVPLDLMDRWQNDLPHFVTEVGPLSTNVFRMVCEGKLLDKDGLSNYVATERLKSRKKRYLVIELD